MRKRDHFHGMPGTHFIACLRNGSTACVYDVVLTFHAGGETLGTDALDVLPPQSTERNVEIPNHAITEWRGLKATRDDANRLRVGISFRDSANRRWRRSPDGMLVLHESSPKPRWWHWRRWPWGR